MSVGPEDQGESQSDFDVDFSGFDAQDAEKAPEPLPAGLSEGDNPKWAPFLEGFPTVLHPQLKEKLREQDRLVNEGFQKRAQEWEPYKRFRDEGVDPDYLHNSYQLARAIEQNPLDILANLQQRLMSDPEFYQAMAERGLLPGQQEEEEEDGFTADSPEQQIAMLQQQMQERDQQIAEYFQQQENARIGEQVYQETAKAIEDDFMAIENQIKQKLPDEIKAQIVQTAMVMGQQTGKYISVIEAAPRVFNLLRSAQASRRAAPNHIPTSGGNLPRPTTSDPADFSKEDRIAAITAMVNQANQQ